MKGQNELGLIRGDFASTTKKNKRFHKIKWFRNNNFDFKNAIIIVLNSCNRVKY